jgi:translocation and assembly module TamA
VLAGFANIGTIDGVSLGELPRDLRLYAGGGGSVRGYGYQMAGPLDAGDNPIGGLSSIETGIELRTKITQTIGIATFFEGGNVYDRSVPDFTHNLRWGAGIGGRYYSPFGPVRVDIATPINPRRADDLIQFYISLGQAF